MPKRYDNNRCLAFGDLHFPYATKGWYEFLEKLEVDYRFDRVICMGDLLDIYSVSSYPKDPDHPDSWSTEIKQARKEVAKLSALFPRMDILDSNHDCFDDQTDILVEGYGFIPFSELTADMKVGTFNRDSGFIEYQKPSRIINQQYNGKMFRVVGRNSVDLLVTPNHRMLVSLGQRRPYEMMTAEELTTRNINRAFFLSGGNSKNTELDSIGDDLLRLVGWYLTDASFRGKKILFHQRVSNSYKISGLLDRLGIPFTSYIKDCSNITEICGRELKKVPENQVVLTISADSLKSLVPNRYKLPEWMSFLSTRQVELLLDILIEADGSLYRDRRTSKILYGTYDFLDQVQALLVCHGYRVSLVRYREKDWKLNITKRSDSCVDKLKEATREEWYTGNIYCAEVPNDTLVVRREGKVTITGNSRAYTRSLLNGVPREFLLPYGKMIGAPESWQFHKELRITVDKDRSKWLFAHTINGGALGAARQLGTSVVVGHSHTKFGASCFNNGHDLLWGVDTGCLISDKGSPFSYNKNQLGRPIRGAAIIIDGIPTMVPFK